MSNPRYFEYALMIEKYGSFKRAAMELHVSQPALSKGIAVLEKEYGILLFDRDSRPLCTTVFGKLVIEEAKRIIEGEKELRSHLLQLKGMVNHKIRIAWGPYVSKVYATAFACAYQETYPKSELFMQTGSWEELPILLRNRQVDLFVGDMSSEPLIKEFSLEPLPQVKVEYICAPHHPLAKKRQIKTAELVTHSLALCNTPPWAKKWLRTYMHNFDPRDSPANIRLNDYRMIREILLANPKVGTLASSSCFAEEIDAGTLIAIPIENAPYFQAGIVYPKPGSQSPILKGVVELMKSVSKAQNP